MLELQEQQICLFASSWLVAKLQIRPDLKIKAMNFSRKLSQYMKKLYQIPAHNSRWFA